MKDLPIIFSAPMVRALIRETEMRGAGKRMTRRLAWRKGRSFVGNGPAHQDHKVEYVRIGSTPIPMSRAPSPYQRVKPGDRLWVRETFQYDVAEMPPIDVSGNPTCREAYIYRATSDVEPERWISPIHMPRKASRLTLIVTATKIEQLQNISPADCRAEGADPLYVERVSCEQCEGSHHGEQWHFRRVWETLHSVESWNTNPEVVALSFHVHRINIDAMPKE